jgi:hypothetical protein
MRVSTSVVLDERVVVALDQIAEREERSRPLSTRHSRSPPRTRTAGLGGKQTFGSEETGAVKLDLARQRSRIVSCRSDRRLFPFSPIA